MERTKEELEQLAKDVIALNTPDKPNANSRCSDSAGSVPLVEMVHKACCESGIHQYCTNVMTDEQPSKYIMAFARKLLAQNAEM